jgi:signal transduction histidine kinase
VDVVRNVSLQVEQEEALATARADAEAALQVKSQFLANMSHEIRTPLTAVLGYSDMLATMTDLDAHAQTYARRISSAGSALLAIINDILDFSKLEAGMVDVRPQPTDVARIIDDTLVLFEGRAAEKGLAPDTGQSDRQRREIHRQWSGLDPGGRHGRRAVPAF